MNYKHHSCYSCNHFIFNQLRDQWLLEDVNYLLSQRMNSYIGQSMNSAFVRRIYYDTENILYSLNFPFNFYPTSDPFIIMWRDVDLHILIGDAVKQRENMECNGWKYLDKNCIDGDRY